jgi:transcriptional regulator with XRE-family HTH domain
MKTKNEEFEVVVPNVDGTGLAERVKVTVPLQLDEELGEWLLAPKAHEIIENTKARHMALLLPAQLRELRERYDFTQKEMGELFQVGEKSWTRWESGKHRPSRSINLLIRALYEEEISLNYLLERAGKPKREEPDWTQPAGHWYGVANCFLSRRHVPVLGEHATSVHIAEHSPSASRGMVTFLRGRSTSAEKKLWRILTVRHHGSPTSSGQEEGTASRFKFSKVA